MANPPIQCPTEFIKFGACAMESDKYITVCESGQIAIIDMTAGNTVTRQKISAEAAIMNPLSKVIALRGALLRNLLYLYFNLLENRPI